LLLTPVINGVMNTDWPKDTLVGAVQNLIATHKWLGEFFDERMEESRAIERQNAVLEEERSDVEALRRAVGLEEGADGAAVGTLLRQVIEHAASRRDR